MQEKESFYFKNDTEWRNWLSKNHSTSEGVYLIFYKVSNKEASMRWEEAVKVALVMVGLTLPLKACEMESGGNISANEIQKVFGVH